MFLQVVQPANIVVCKSQSLKAVSCAQTNSLTTWNSLTGCVDQTNWKTWISDDFGLYSVELYNALHSFVLSRADSFTGGAWESGCSATSPWSRMAHNRSMWHVTQLVEASKELKKENDQKGFQHGPNDQK